jgi:uncharacterized protein (TIGR03086 family)
MPQAYHWNGTIRSVIVELFIPFQTGEGPVIEPFTARVPEADLRRRLAATRWAPEQPAGAADGAYGVPLTRVRRLVARWLEYDWRGCEDRLNAYPQFLATIDGQPVHFPHVRSAVPGAFPVLLPPPSHRYQQGELNAMPEYTWSVVTDSLALLRDAAALVSDANREAPTPCSEWTVAQVLQHALGDQLAWAAAAGVGTGPSENPFAPSGRIEGSVDDLVRPALAAARNAWARVRSDDEAVPTPLPQGALPAPAAAAACALDAAVHAWDITVALGQPGPLPDELAARLIPAARAIAEPLRQFGAYAAALPPRPGDTHTAELLRYLGRDPEWAAGQ